MPKTRCCTCGFTWTPGLPGNHSCSTQLRALLDNLLAVIHRDGGHHTSDVGLEQSVADAHKRWAELAQLREQSSREHEAWEATKPEPATKEKRIEPLESGLEAMRERDGEGSLEIERLQGRIAKLEGHLDWIGWSSDGIERARAELAALRKAFEEQECTCPRWRDDPCSRCQLMKTWGRETSKHPGLEKLKLPAEGVLYKRAMERSAEIRKGSEVSDG